MGVAALILYTEAQSFFCASGKIIKKILLDMGAIAPDAIINENACEQAPRYFH